MCCAEFLVKYILFFANLLFTLAGAVLIGLGIAVLVQLNQIQEVIPGVISTISIFVIVLGCIIFVIAFFGCCGAIRESRCLLAMYFICMGILAAVKIFLATVIFRGLSTIQTTVQEWVDNAFANEKLRETFHVLETLFSCCGSYGPGSYAGIYPGLPPSCCPLTDAQQTQQCTAAQAFGGCRDILGDYFETFGDAIGGVLIAIIIVELVAMLLGIFMCCSVSNNRQRRQYY